MSMAIYDMVGSILNKARIPIGSDDVYFREIGAICSALKCSESHATDLHQIWANHEFGPNGEIVDG